MRLFSIISICLLAVTLSACSKPIEINELPGRYVRVYSDDTREELIIKHDGTYEQTIQQIDGVQATNSGLWTYDLEKRSIKFTNIIDTSQLKNPNQHRKTVEHRGSPTGEPDWWKFAGKKVGGEIYLMVGHDPGPKFKKIKD